MAIFGPLQAIFWPQLEFHLACIISRCKVNVKTSHKWFGCTDNKEGSNLGSYTLGEPSIFQYFLKLVVLFWHFWWFLATSSLVIDIKHKEYSDFKHQCSKPICCKPNTLLFQRLAFFSHFWLLLGLKVLPDDQNYFSDIYFHWTSPMDVWNVGVPSM